jgi:hypothetical protein
MIVTRPIMTTEPDLLLNKENLALIITDLAKSEIKRISPPQSGWTHNLLESIEYNEIAANGWEAFLGDTNCWIGSSEV